MTIIWVFPCSDYDVLFSWCEIVLDPEDVPRTLPLLLLKSHQLPAWHTLYSEDGGIKFSRNIGLNRVNTNREYIALWWIMMIRQFQFLTLQTQYPFRLRLSLVSRIFEVLTRERDAPVYAFRYPGQTRIVPAISDGKESRDITLRDFSTDYAIN
jgi:hypothetical protein